MNSLQDTYLFVGDLHLGGFSEDTNQLLVEEFRLLTQWAIENRSRLVILGDFLDYYMQYGTEVPDVAVEPLNLLNQYHKITGLHPIYVTGNHDNWDQGYFETMGCITVHEYLILELGGRRVLIAHGDGLKDPSMRFPRPKMHRFLRNITFVSIYQKLTGVALGNWIMRHFSRMNRMRNENGKSTGQRIELWAKWVLDQDIANVVLCGHSHATSFKQFNQRLYINAGAFFENRQCAIYNNGIFSIVRWNSDTGTFDTVHQESPK